MIPGAMGWKCENGKYQVVDFGSLNVLVVQYDDVNLQMSIRAHTIRQMGLYGHILI